MPHMALYDMAGEKTGEIEVPEELFGLPMNQALVHQAVVAVDHQRKRRCGKAKTRSEVSLSGVKWYRQKGLGRARHGARSAPVFVGGGKAHGPVGVPGTHKMPKRMRRKALFTALSERLRKGGVTLVDGVRLETISTKRFAKFLDDLRLGGRILMLLSSEEAGDDVLYKSARNVPNLIAREIPHFNTREVLWAEEVLLTKGALEQLMEAGTADAD